MNSDNENLLFKQSWVHAPFHLLSKAGVYFITSGTYLKQHFFNTPEKLDYLLSQLFLCSKKFDWTLEAWAIFPNHYHFVAHSNENVDSGNSLAEMIGYLHQTTAKWINKMDNTAGRKIWHNFWDTKLTYQRSYLARLNYTHQNAVKHRVVVLANQYPWCSARWFETTAKSTQVKMIYNLKLDSVNVNDNYDVMIKW